MTIVAHSHSFVIGVDTHARHHVLAVLAGNGQLIDTGSFPTSRAGLARAIAWAGRRAGGDLAALWVIEGIGSYGAQLPRHRPGIGCEAPRMAPRPAGKNDCGRPTDRRVVLPLITQLRHRPAQGERAAMQIL